MVDPTTTGAGRTDALADDGGRVERDGPAVLLFSGEHAERLASLDDAPNRLGGSKLLWVDAQSPTEKTAREITAELGLDERARVALISPSETTASFRDAGAFVHLTVHAPDANTADALQEVECIVGENWVVTAHDRPVSVLDEFAELAGGSGRTGDLDGPSFLAALMEWVLNEYGMAFERIEEELEELDDHAMRGKRAPDDEIAHLVALRRRAGGLRRSLAAHRTPLLALTHPELEALGDAASARRFEMLLDRYEATVQSARDARDSIVSSFDVLIARTGYRTNEIMKVLTLASVVLLPGALVAGVMGMNFKVGVFDHPVGFWFVVAGIVTVGVVTLAVAKLRDWI